MAFARVGPMQIAESDGSTHTIPVEMSLPELTDYVAKLNDANQAVRELRS